MQKSILFWLKFAVKLQNNPRNRKLMMMMMDVDYKQKGISFGK